jgi:hypothetical protein
MAYLIETTDRRYFGLVDDSTPDWEWGFTSDLAQAIHYGSEENAVSALAWLRGVHGGEFYAARVVEQGGGLWRRLALWFLLKRFAERDARPHLGGLNQ